MKPRKSVTIRMPEDMIDRLTLDADGLNITFSALVIEILYAQMKGKKFSTLDYLVARTFKKPGE